MTEYSGELRSPHGARYAIIASRWNPQIVDVLINAATGVFADHGVAESAMDLVRVPGAWDIPVVAARLASDGRASVLVALGCVVRGDTRHYEHVADGCAQGLMQVATQYRVPVLNGVLAVERLADAQARAGAGASNKGAEVALAAIEMADLWSQW